MKKAGKRILSALLAIILLFSSVAADAELIDAATENGYDRGYDGGFAGDGKIYCEGLDLSSWQAGAVNFTAIKASGYDYVILRVGTSKMPSKDTCFDQFYEEAKAAGLDVGAYFYSYATTESAVQEDITKCKEWLAGKKFEYPFYFDYEDSSQADLPSATALSIINTFIDAFVEEGYLMGLYSMKSWMTQSWITSSSLPSTYEGWVAHYAGDGTYDAGYSKYGDTYSTQYGMYQYTDKHYFTYNGVTYGPYDADICYKDYPAIVKEYGFNGYEPSGLAAAKESLQTTVDLTMDITHRDYTEAAILEIRSAYKTAVALLSSDSATKDELDAANTTLTNLLANTGSNTIANNNEGVEIKGRNQKITSGDCILYSPTWNDGLITVSNANIAYTVNVVFKWDENLGFNVVKSISYGTGTSTPDIQLEADEFLLAAHDWETNVTSGAVEGSAKNYQLLANLKVGDKVKLSGATALNNGTDVEPAAYAKFLPKGSVAVYGRNTAVKSSQTVLFTSDYNSGLLTAANSNIHLTLNVRAKWNNTENAWVIVEKTEGDGTTGESSNIELASDEILFAAHYNTADAASIANWGYLYDAEVGQKITFFGISPETSKTAISCAANISFSDRETEDEAAVNNNLALNKEYVSPAYPDSPYTADLTDGKASQVFQANVNNSSWFGFLNTGDASTGNINPSTNRGLVTIDLAGTAEMTAVKMNTFAGSNSAGATNFDYINVYTSADGVDYIFVGTILPTSDAAAPYWATLDFSSTPVEGRYVKLAVSAAEGELVLINEVQVIGEMLDDDITTEAGSMSTVVLAGSFNNWNATPNMVVVDETKVSATLELEEGTYEFKILGGNTWYGHNGQINDTTVTSSAEGILMTADAGDNVVLNASGGKYTFIYDKMTNDLQVLYVPDTCYIRGDFNDWGTEDVMTDNGDGTLSVTLTLEAGTYEYKAANEDFSKEWPQFNAVLELERKSQVIFKLDVTNNTLTADVYGLEYYVTFVDYDGTVLSRQAVATGTAATAPEVPARDGYRFESWDMAFDNVTEDITVRAQYKATRGTLKIDIDGGSGFSISVNGAAARPQGTYYVNSKMEIGSLITVTAKTNDSNKFLGWIDPANGKILSSELTYSFYTGGNDYIKALFQAEVEGTNFVIFQNDKSGQYFDMQYYTAGDEVVFPDAPTQVGYDFAGWDHTEEEIQAKLTAGEDVVVTATWTVAQVYVDITVTGGTIVSHGGQNDAGQYLAAKAVTVEADAAAEGMKFAYWKDGNGNVRGYDTTYKFYPGTDTELTAVYVEEGVTVAREVLVYLDSCDTSGAYGTFLFSWYVPEEENGLTYQGAGIVAVNKANYKESTLYHGTTDSNVWDRSATGSSNTASNTYAWVGPVYAGNTWAAMAWVQYTDADGNTVVEYSELFEITKY